ncbi:MAG TPA: murein biosynthesis integral membrane protein MurJ [Ktedonobacterales bacterium]|nr:murein biosynthesis integral membrane protein MurJ [Ktedonobacterales bacterium]
MEPGHSDDGPYVGDRSGAAPQSAPEPPESGDWSMPDLGAPAGGDPAPQVPRGLPALTPPYSGPHAGPASGAIPPWGEPGSEDASPWDAPLRRTYPGVSVDDLTGTGKFNAVVPLAPGESAWGRGVSAPQPPRSVRGKGAFVTGMPEAAAIPTERAGDSQPSARMRALEPGNLARATAIVSGAILISRVLGLFRTSFFAYVFGASRAADAFTYAFTLPDVIFNIVAGGALASAFIPVFTDYLVNRRDRKTAWHVASAAFNISTLVLIIFAALCIVFADPILRLAVPPLFSHRPGETPLGPQVVTLTQVMLLQPILLGAATMGVAVLQARQRFLLPAIGQVIYNVGLIGGIAATYADLRWGVFGGHLGIMGPTWGVVAGAALQFVILIPGLVRAKMRYRPTFDFAHPGVRHMFALMGPRIFNSAASYAAIIVTTNFLAYISVTGNADAVNYGYRTAFSLMLLPLGLFGMAVSQAAFPTLSALVADRQWPRLRTTVTRTLRGMIYLAVPSALGLAVLADPISRLLLAHGHFSARDVSIVATPLIYFSIGLVGLATDEVLVRCFYALHDSRTPVFVNIANLAFVIGLSVILIAPLGAGGLALAFALGAVGEAPVLLLLLSPRIGGLNLRELMVFLLNVLAASLVTALTALFTYTLLNRLAPGASANPAVETVTLAVRLYAAIGVASAVYFLFSRFLGIDDAIPLERILNRLRPRRRR